MGKRYNKKHRQNDEKLSNNQVEMSNEIVENSNVEVVKLKKKKVSAGNISLERPNTKTNISSSTEEEIIGVQEHKMSKKRRKKDRVHESHVESSDNLSNGQEIYNSDIVAHGKVKLEKRKKTKNNVTEGETLVYLKRGEIDKKEVETNDIDQIKVTKKKRKNSKAIEPELLGDSSNLTKPKETDETKAKVSKKNTSKRKKHLQTVETNRQNKKIIFNDDTGEPQDFANTVSSSNNNSEKRIRYKKPIIREEEPDDADIDKFCDEIDEEDNAQYENWIQLIEAKLGPDKKKGK